MQLLSLSERSWNERVEYMGAQRKLILRVTSTRNESLDQQYLVMKKKPKVLQSI